MLSSGQFRAVGTGPYLLLWGQSGTTGNRTSELRFQSQNALEAKEPEPNSRIRRLRDVLRGWANHLVFRRIRKLFSRT